MHIAYQIIIIFKKQFAIYIKCEPIEPVNLSESEKSLNDDVTWKNMALHKTAAFKMEFGLKVEQRVF